MKKIILICATLLTSFGIQAQKAEINPEAVNREGNSCHHPKHKMAGKPDLSSSQREAMKAAHQKYYTQLAALQTQTNLSLKTFNERKDLLDAALYQQKQNILTPEQKQQLADQKMAKRKTADEKYEKHMNIISGKLALNEDQVSRMRKLHETNKVEFQKIKENPAFDKEEKKMQLFLIKQKAKTEMQQILTPEQFKKMEAMKGSRADKNGHPKQS
jgi:Spy/CpxP family protein refolding chaperone